MYIIQNKYVPAIKLLQQRVECVLMDLLPSLDTNSAVGRYPDDQQRRHNNVNTMNNEIKVIEKPMKNKAAINKTSPYDPVVINRI